ncbi:MAG: FtsQ-type POTRA domain-containing protein, partial [Deltaproteobacteria bacterium]|nr:FtsQ-type POTRA domain-containing protein [Deltaproteobacteria bacterium]
PHHIKMLAAVPIEKITLFELDLTEIEKRILVDPWIKKVKLEKVFPNSVRISTQFRKPIALLQGEKANISYLDEEGIIFGRLNLTLKEDLPIISGVPLKDSYLVQKILNLLQLWEASGLKKLPPISNVLYEEDKGYRVIISYPLVKNQTQSLLKNRVIVELGHQINEETKASLEQLDKDMAFYF